MKKYRYVILIIFFAVIIGLGVSYSYFIADYESTSQVLQTGEAYVTVTGNSTINLNDIVPIATAEINTKASKYSFTIKGKNKSDSDLEYVISLLNGDDISSKTRLDNIYVFVSLKNIDNGNNYLLLRGKLSELNTLYSDIIPANTNTEITRNYELLIWIEGDITNTTNLYANYKINVEADFNDNYTSSSNNYLLNKVIEGSYMDNVSSPYVTSNTGIDFSQMSSDTNGKGVYQYHSSSTNYYPIYYYRGAVNNNTVLFANYCWKIVRTTDSGGIRLAYYGEPTNNQCPSTSNEPVIQKYTYFAHPSSDVTYSLAAVGYMFGEAYPPHSGTLQNGSLTGSSFTWDGSNYTLTNTSSSFNATHHYTCNNTTGICPELHYSFYNVSTSYNYLTLKYGKSIDDVFFDSNVNINNSYIKNIVDNWYSQEISSTQYENKLDDSIYCNKRSITEKGSFDPSNLNDDLHFINSQSYNIVDFSCDLNDSFTVNKSSKGNGNLTYPIALLTADEVVIAGGTYEEENSNFYLGSPYAWWLLTPISYYVGEMNPNTFIAADGLYLIRSSFDDGDFGVRPAITLNSNMIITSGNGTSNSPFVID